MNKIFFMLMMMISIESYSSEMEEIVLCLDSTGGEIIVLGDKKTSSQGWCYSGDIEVYMGDELISRSKNYGCSMVGLQINLHEKISTVTERIINIVEYGPSSIVYKGISSDREDHYTLHCRFSY